MEMSRKGSLGTTNMGKRRKSEQRQPAAAVPEHESDGERRNVEAKYENDEPAPDARKASATSGVSLVSFIILCALVSSLVPVFIVPIIPNVGSISFSAIKRVQEWMQSLSTEMDIAAYSCSHAYEIGIAHHQPLVLQISDFLSEFESSYLISMAMKQFEVRTKPTKNSKAYVGQAAPPPRSTSDAVLDQVAHDKVVQCVSERYSRLLASSESKDPFVIEPLHVARFVAGQAYPVNSDPNTFSRHHTASAFVFLNSIPSELGGATQLSSIGQSFHPKRGLAVFWMNHMADARIVPTNQPMREDGVQKWVLTFSARQSAPAVSVPKVVNPADPTTSLRPRGPGAVQSKAQDLNEKYKGVKFYPGDPVPLGLPPLPPMPPLPDHMGLKPPAGAQHQPGDVIGEEMIGGDRRVYVVGGSVNPVIMRKIENAPPAKDSDVIDAHLPKGSVPLDASEVPAHIRKAFERDTGRKFNDAKSASVVSTAAPSGSPDVHIHVGRMEAIPAAQVGGRAGDAILEKRHMRTGEASDVSLPESIRRLLRERRVRPHELKRLLEEHYMRGRAPDA